MWLSFALLAPLLFSVSVFIDKYLLAKGAHALSAGSLTILAGISGIPLLLIFGVLARHQIAAYTSRDALTALFSGGMVILAYYFYYRAIAIADASLVATLFQLMVVFSYIFARIFLSERLSVAQLLAILLIVAGSVTLNVENREGEWQFKPRVLILMTISCALLAASDVIFKSVAQRSSFLPTQFYSYGAAVLIGVLVFALNTASRGAFLTTMRQRLRGVLGLAQLNEAVNLGGLLLANYALLLAPVAVIAAVMSVQSLYMILMGMALTLLFPQLIKENIGRENLILKLLSTLLIIIGTVGLVL